MVSRVMVQSVDNNVCVVRCGVWYIISMQIDSDRVRGITYDKSSV